ncbi:MAG: DUF1738 domain-containing protein [Phycisphaeraceae bacterium]|nr:hypothetical protein [Phycisphaerales bacterium]MCB9842342.1 DUF1738 domain-containing protein [Phycisphaeraceae bacterium]
MSAGSGGSGAANQPTASKTDQVRQIVDRAVADLAEQLDHGDRSQLDAFLAALSRFHRYSINNVFLILSQRPEATRVAGFHTWRSLGRAVKRGEKGIAIFAPMLLRPKQTPQLENAEQDRDTPQLRFRVVHVFDISQTEGEPLPSLDRIGGDPGEALIALESAVTASGIVLETVDSLGGAEGISSGGRIRLREGLSPAERFSVLAHEWAHEKLHQTHAPSERPDKVVRETEAEAVAFVVSQAIGLETGSASADYIRLYRGDKETLAASLDRIQKTACSIIQAIQDPDSAKSPSLPQATHSQANPRERSR